PAMITRPALRACVPVIVALLCGAAVPAAQPSSPFEPFTDRTMRVDFFHTGSTGREILSLDAVVSDGPWAGSQTRLIDDTNLGPYFFEVIDRATNQPIYSRGFASIYGEWETTEEARQGVSRTFHESLRFPWPKAPVQVVVKKRDRDNAFREVWTTVVDPASRFVTAAEAQPQGRVWSVFENGPAATKVDLLILGDGYSEAQLPKFHADVKRMVAVLFEHEPFKSRRADFNVRAIDLPTAASGVNRPRTRDFRRTPIGVSYNIFDSERYALVEDNRSMRNIAAAAPYDFLEVLINEEHYGGGGIFNDHATAAVDTAFAEYIFVHEFGHHFAGLGDEYYTSDVAYETGVAERPEPWEPNVTAQTDLARLKWRDLVAPGTPIPTPWDKATYEEKSREVQEKRRQLRATNAPESEMNALLTAEREWSTAFLAAQKHAGQVGAFEGAAYEPTGLYRPAVDCIMFTRDQVGFCLVCQRAVSRIIDMHSR
ncbi:MAG TPA: IgA Peptidase M64, partial [Vicinamibacterales bacterium]|nr:IgA Peptidase M64 [Vicinamibacterales bacterium]